MYVYAYIAYECYKIVFIDKSIDEMANYTSIRVEKEVRDDLDSLGKRRESYNVIIKRLIAYYRENYSEEKEET